MFMAICEIKPHFFLLKFRKNVAISSIKVKEEFIKSQKRFAHFLYKSISDSIISETIFKVSDIKLLFQFTFLNII